MLEMRNAYRIFVGKPEGKRLFGRHKRKWVDNIRIDLWEMGWEFVDRNYLDQEIDQLWALVSTVLNLRVPYKE
jgi:hypothetical protein